MIKNRLARWLVPCTALAVFLAPAVAHAEEVAGPVGEWQSYLAKAFAASIAMGMSGLGAGYAQAKIGSAGAGTLAERPEVSTWILLLQALPEIIALLGFVAAIMILNMPVTPAG